MACCYFVKADGEENYKLMVIDTCSGSTASSAAVRSFVKNNPGITPKKYDPNIHDLNMKVWVVSAQGVAKLEELFELYVGDVKVILDPNKPTTQDNVGTALGWLARRVDSKPPEPLPGLEHYLG